MSILKLIFSLLAAALSLAQAPRLFEVEKIYIEDLGAEDAAHFVRDQLIGAFFNRTRGIILVTSRDQADAVLIGTANIRDGYRTWSIGSHQTSTAAAAVATSGGSASAASSESSTRRQSGGGTIRITELGLQLVSPDGRILWAYDGTKCLNTSLFVLTGIPAKNPTTVCAVQQLAKAMDKDERDRRKGR